MANNVPFQVKKGQQNLLSARVTEGNSEIIVGSSVIRDRGGVPYINGGVAYQGGAFVVGNGNSNAPANVFAVTNNGLAKAFGTPTSSYDLIPKWYADQHYSGGGSGGGSVYQHQIKIAPAAGYTPASSGFGTFNGILYSSSAVPFVFDSFDDLSILNNSTGFGINVGGGDTVNRFCFLTYVETAGGEPQLFECIYVKDAGTYVKSMNPSDMSDYTFTDNVFEL